jgi:hypothetical protein
MYRHEGHHRLSDAEADILSRAVGALHAFSGSAVSQRAFDSINTFLDALTPEGSLLRFTTDPIFRNEVSMAAEQMLSQYVAVRRRTSTAAAKQFGAEARSRVDAVFEHAYLHDGNYRTMWELRNASEHGYSLYDLVHVVSDLQADESHRARMMFDLKMLESISGTKTAAVLRERWGGARESNLIDDVRLSAERLKTLMARVYLALEPELLAAANKVAEHTQEIAHLVGDKILYRIVPEPSGTITIKRVDLSLVDLSAIHFALVASRERLAPPRLGPSGVAY